MKTLKVISFNSNKEILLLDNDGKYDLPSFTCNDNINYKEFLKKALKEKYKLKTKDEYFIYKFSCGNTLYYYSEEPYNKDEFKKNANNLLWINEMELKDFLSAQKENYNELIKVLSRALRTNFSYSLKEREKNEEAYNNAKNTLEKNYIASKHINSIIGHDPKKLDNSYKKIILEEFNKDINLIITLKEKEYIDSLKASKLSELTYKEACLISKDKEWNELLDIIYPKLYLFLLKKDKNNLNGKKYDILEEEIKLSEKKDFTPAILINLCQKCINSSFDDIFNDMLKRRKKANKEKNNSC